MMFLRFRSAFLGSLLIASCLFWMETKLVGQDLASDSSASSLQAEEPFPQDLFSPMSFRNIGPFRGGRVTAVCGCVDDPLTYFMGSTGGGVWKTQDAGMSWRILSDDVFRTSSVGAIAVAPSDSDIVYVGMGEAPVRGVATSHGDGVYRTRDGGVTWERMGLENTRHISGIQVDPRDPQRLFVGAQGSPYGDSDARGVFRSVDGGETWEHVLWGTLRSGVSSLSMDPHHPDRLYASMWDHRRLPWKVESGGEGSGIYRSLDGGDTWERMENGLPELMGKIGVVVSPADPRRLYAIIEAEKGGLYRSDDGGVNWRLINPDRVIQTRSWYYMHVFAHPLDADTVYVLNAPMLRSTDGGQSFSPMRTPHGDNHGLWIHPEQPNWMINGNDGGANVSNNGGLSWSTQSNQPTGQFYRVSTDRGTPYRIYGGQQDNSTVSIPSQTFGRGIGEGDWYSVGGCESAHIAFDPDDPRFVYAGCYHGIISEYDHQTRSTRDIRAYPELSLGQAPRDLRYRFNWNAPILVSPHDSKVIFHAGNVLLKSLDRGVSWKEVSPDLTRNNPDYHGYGGGPITREGAGGENYNTILSFVESSHHQGVFWVGSDDGLVHLSRNGGKKWTRVSPKDSAPDAWGEVMINSIEVSPHVPSKVLVAATGYKRDDFSPMIFWSDDYGATWTKKVLGIPENEFVRVVREDPVVEGLLYAGTELGLRVSWNDGAHWSEFISFPTVPVTDLAIRDGDLIASTQGRGFWILDDLTPLRAWAKRGTKSRAEPVRLLASAPTFRDAGGSGRGVGANPTPGGWIQTWVDPEAEEFKADDYRLEIMGEDGTVIRAYASKPDREASPPVEKLSLKPGLNRLIWNLRYPGLKRVDGLFVYGSQSGPRVAPGKYRVKLSGPESDQFVILDVLEHPAREELDYGPQQALALEVWGLADQVNRTLIKVRDIRSQLGTLKEKLSRHSSDEVDELKRKLETLVGHINRWEGLVAQPKQKTFQDVINFENGFNAMVFDLLGAVDGSPPPVSQGHRQRFSDLTDQWGIWRLEVDRWLEQDVPQINREYAALELPVILSGREGDR